MRCKEGVIIVMSTKVGHVTQRAMEIVKRSLRPERKDRQAANKDICAICTAEINQEWVIRRPRAALPI